MVICKVVGHVWATKKEESLNGLKLMVVKKIGGKGGEDGVFVAADLVGAGVGERVLIVTGSTAREAFGRNKVSVDSAIVGIIDVVEVDQEMIQNKERLNEA